MPPASPGSCAPAPPPRLRSSPALSLLPSSNTGEAEIHAVGAAAVNQAVKAIAVASRFPDFPSLCLVPAFMDLQFPDGERTGIRLIVRLREQGERSG
ncbi:MAG: stage V sporulation protein S [Dehalococcoidia bacterium]|nr:stage V sporulation protein S [Dehalococcoidia bacterium]